MKQENLYIYAEPMVGDTRPRLHEIPGSKYGVWIIETYRKCLACDVGFWSWGPDNRICESCRSDPNYQAVSDAVDRNVVSVYDEESLEVDKEDRPVKEVPKGWGRKLKCPRCGEIVYRPGNAASHKCFQWALEDVTMKLNSHIQVASDLRPANHGRRIDKEPGLFGKMGEELSPDNDYELR